MHKNKRGDYCRDSFLHFPYWPSIKMKNSVQAFQGFPVPDVPANSFQASGKGSELRLRGL